MIGREHTHPVTALHVHNTAHSLHALGHDTEADAAAIEALQTDDGSCRRIAFMQPTLAPVLCLKEPSPLIL